MAAVRLCRKWDTPRVGNTCHLLPKLAPRWNILGRPNAAEITMRYGALFMPLGIRGWRTHPRSPVPKQQLPNLLFPWPSAHRGLAEPLSLMFCRSGLWGTGTCSALACRGGSLLWGLAVLQATLCVRGGYGELCRWRPCRERGLLGLPPGLQGSSA